MKLEELKNLTLEQLAQLINQTHRRIGLRQRRSWEESVLVGSWLVEAKSRIPHGQWLPWIEQHLDIGERMVRYYMQAAKTPDKAKQVNSIHDFARLHLETKKAASKEERKAFVDEAVANLLPIQKNWHVHEANNQAFDWPTVDHIWTDPPWPSTAKELDHYKWLASMAWQNLKKGGLLAVQCGQTDLAKVLPLFQQFHYITVLAIVYHQACNKVAYCFLANWRPVLLFSKGKVCLQEPVTDTITVSNRKLVKVYHPWQQPLEPFVKWIPALTKPGDVIADPFTCTGTIALACKMTGRRFVGTEVNPDMVAVARKRLAECGEGRNIQAG